MSLHVNLRYRPIVFEQGEFRFDPSAGAYVAALIGVAAVVATVATYRGVSGRRRRDRVVLIGLRAAALGLVLFCLFRPVLVVRAAVPQQNVLAVLLDDSLSMQVPDWDGQPRAAFVTETFGGADRPMVAALAERFLVRPFRFSSNATRQNPSEPLTFSGGQTRIGDALDAVRHELAGLPVAGIVVVTDGADTGTAALSESLLGLKAEKIPVFTVGVGEEAPARDIQVDRIGAPRSVLMGSSLLVDVAITHQGYGGETLTVDVEDEGRLVGSEQVRLVAGGGPATVRIRAIASEPGPRVFRFRVPALPGELVTQNNVREVTINVLEGREKILYFEGEPRFEMKFLRRAVADDKNLQVVALQRTADNKYLRLGVDSPDELVAGFPKTREELFAYRGLVLGSVEAGAFTGDQLRMIADFVDRRGGGLLVIGGGRSFAEGGYAGTPVADVLPAELERDAQGGRLVRLAVRPTQAGGSDAVTQLAATEEASAARWAALPQVTSVNALGRLKPGATVLLEGVDEGGRSQPVLLSQRYGRGKSIAFSVQDSWLWQMHASIPLEDQSHENFWRQVLRGLIDGVPRTVEATVSADRVEPGETVTLDAMVVDPTFVELNDATVIARVTPPDGEVFDVPMPWTGDQAGRYRGAFTATAPGRYHTDIVAERAGQTLGTAAAYVRAGAGDAEYFDAAMQAATLRRIAEETGGRFYTPDSVAGLSEDVRYAARGVTTVEERELWHMPIILIALLGIVCAEWGYRRAMGLA